MTDAPTQLDPFEGQPVLSVGIEIPGAAGGLRDALKIDPVQLRHGEKAYVLLETTTDKIRFDPDKDEDGWKRVHVLAVEQGMLVDADLVADHLATQRARIAEAHAQAALEKRREAGEFTLDEAALDEAHDNGDHASGLVPGCPQCDHEAALEAAENESPKAAPASIEDRP
jgi:hypothetical protein